MTFFLVYLHCKLYLKFVMLDVFSVLQAAVLSDCCPVALLTSQCLLCVLLKLLKVLVNCGLYGENPDT